MVSKNCLESRRHDIFSGPTPNEMLGARFLGVVARQPASGWPLQQRTGVVVQAARKRVAFSAAHWPKPGRACDSAWIAAATAPILDEAKDLCFSA